MGTGKVKFEEELPEVTSPSLTRSDVSNVTRSDVTGSHVTGSDQEPEVIACACATGTFCATTIVIEQNLVQ